MTALRRYLIARRVRRLAARQSALLAERSALPTKINANADALFLARRKFEASCGDDEHNLIARG